MESLREIKDGDINASKMRTTSMMSGQLATDTSNVGESSNAAFKTHFAQETEKVNQNKYGKCDIFGTIIMTAILGFLVFFIIKTMVNWNEAKINEYA